MSAHSIVTQSVTISNTAQTLSDMGFSAAQIAGAVGCMITGSGGDLRYRQDGTAPTATVGHIIKDEITTEILQYIASIQLIRQSVDVAVTIDLDTFV